MTIAALRGAVTKFRLAQRAKHLRSQSYCTLLSFHRGGRWPESAAQRAAWQATLLAWRRVMHL